MISALRSGDIDGFVDDDVAMVPLDAEPDLRLAFTLPTQNHWGVAARKGNDPLRQALDDALASVIADGHTRDGLVALDPLAHLSSAGGLRRRSFKDPELVRSRTPSYTRSMRILYLATSGTSDPTRASLPLHIAANGSVAAGQECALVLVGDATELAVSDTADQVVGVGVPPAKELFQKLLDNRVPVFV